MLYAYTYSARQGSRISSRLQTLQMHLLFRPLSSHAHGALCFQPFTVHTRPLRVSVLASTLMTKSFHAIARKAWCCIIRMDGYPRGQWPNGEFIARAHHGRRFRNPKEKADEACVYTTLLGRKKKIPRTRSESACEKCIWADPFVADGRVAEPLTLERPPSARGA
jgi:hypothetical protein